MELCLASQIFYWNEMMMIPSQTVQAAGNIVLHMNILGIQQIHLLRNVISQTTEQVNIWSK